MAWDLVKDRVLKPGFLEREMKKIAKDDGSARVRSDLKVAEDRRRKIDKQVKQLIECQMENAESKLLAAALKEKLRGLDAEAEELDRHIADLRDRIEALGQRGRTIDAFLAAIDKIRERARAGLLDQAEKRDIIEMLAARIYAWKEGTTRRVRVELPFGTRCENLESTMGCST